MDTIIGLDQNSPFPDLEDLDLQFDQFKSGKPADDQNFAAKNLHVSVQLDDSDHLFRYLSEIQREAKGGYIKGKIVVEKVDYLTQDSFLMDLSLASDQDSCEVSPNLLLFTHWKRKKRGLQVVVDDVNAIQPFMFK